MTIQKLLGAVREHRRLIVWMLAALAAVCWLMLYKLGSLVGGLSQAEVTAATTPVGWHGIYNQPLDMPLKLARSVVFALFPDHGQTLTRVPNVLFGALAIISFGGLVRLWHGRRTAVLATALFAFGAWTLHASRLASFDVLYLWAMPTLIYSHYLLRKYYQKRVAWYGNIIIWGLMLYIPGLVWLVVADIVIQRKFLSLGWKYHKLWRQRMLSLFLGLIWLPLLGAHLARSGQAIAWLGLPAHFSAPLTVLKQFAAVPIHLFVRGPQYPEFWLGKAPVLDVFVLITCVLGIYFYVTHRQSPRSRYLAALAFFGFVLVGLGGPVGLSLLVPLLYVAAATGLAYLLHDWLKTFPNNPLARSLGVGIIVFAVALSCLYNYRAYFVAWPHNAATKVTFQYRR